jgi:catechol 2,3-dioxygenase-like lactoylglutathione lyase family enzyme
MTLFQPSRDQARRFFVDAWRKYRDGRPLEPLEALAAELVLRHPEYHDLLEDEEESLTREWPPELGETNPFLHLGLHLAIREQLSIDQPAGIVARYQTLLQRLGDEHAALHVLMDCLAEAIWQAQRYHQPLDGARYLACVEDRSRP